MLGRGVDALLPGLGQEEEDRYFMCDVDKILPNPQQPRSYFDKEKLQQLADSIREKGVIQPLLVTKSADDESKPYTLIAGERRLRAAKMAGCEEVPVVLMDETRASESLELALIENIQRHDLNPIEEAKAYQRLMEEFRCTQEDVARKVGRSRTTITNILRLLALPESVQNDVIENRISEGHARVLLRLKEHPERLHEVRRRIVAESLSVRATERLCAKTQESNNDSNNTSSTDSSRLSSGASSASPPPHDPSREGGLSASYCSSLTTQLTNHFHTKVRIVQQGSRGRVEIEYYSSDDLDRLLALLCQ